MRTFLPIIAILLSWPAYGQGERGGRLASAFSRIDTDGDGIVTKVEASRSERLLLWFSEADKDQDGLTFAEAKAYFASRPDALPKGEDEEVLTQTYDYLESSGISESNCIAAAEYSAARNGFSMLVAVDGQTVFERYESGRSPEEAHRLASGTKSFSGALLALAVKDGLLFLDEPVSETIGEWQTEERLSKITIRQLLSLTSGIKPGPNGDVPSYTEAIQAVSVGAPGEKFAYGPAAFQIFGEVLRRKLEQREDFQFDDPLAYLEERIFNQIGLEYSHWRRDENGMPHLPSGAFLNAREWVKFGELLRNGGSWNGEDLVDPETLKACLKGSPANSGYGLTFWLLDAGEGEKELAPWQAGAYMAAGKGKQRLFILPAKNVVIVRQGDSRQFDDTEFLNLLFQK